VPKKSVPSGRANSNKNGKPRVQAHKRRTTPLPPDAREQLFNERQIGPDTEVQVSTERIVKLSGILFDLDADKLKQGPLIPNLSLDPNQFYSDCVQSWISRHPILEQLEIRVSGTGLHGILSFDKPIEFADDAERDRWCSICKIIQATLPTDPRGPGITATTRPLGSINSKNKKKVRLLRKGTKLTPQKAIELQQQMCAAPFKTLFHILTGADRMSPCPFCSGEGKPLEALNYVGFCYGCGKVTFETLCHHLYQDGASKKD
jgi:hypothetical protein